MSKPTLWRRIVSKLTFWIGQLKYWIPFLLSHRKCTICAGVGEYGVTSRNGLTLRFTCKLCDGVGWRKRWE